MDEEFIDIPTAATELGLSERQVARLTRQRAVPRFTLPGHGRRLFIRRSSLTDLQQPLMYDDVTERVSPASHRARSSATAPGSVGHGQLYDKISCSPRAIDQIRPKVG